MIPRRILSFAVFAVLALGAGAAPAGAIAGPVLNLDVHHGPTNAIPGGAPSPSFVETNTQGSASANEEQRLWIFADTGVYRLHFGAEVTADLPYNATAGQIEAALAGLSSIGPSDIDIVIAPILQDGGRRYDVTFTGALANADVPELSVSDGTPRLGIDPELWIDLQNVGDASTSGPITLTVTLPAGLRRNSFRIGSTGSGKDDVDDDPYGTWSCPGSLGDAVITCTNTGPIPRHSFNTALVLVLDVTAAPGTIADRTLRATVTGGGAPTAPAAAGCAGAPWNAPTAAACATDVVHIDSSEAPFGILPQSFTPNFLAADGTTPLRGAGAHPDNFVVPLDFTAEPDPTRERPLGKSPVEPIRNITVDLPPGFFGDPTVVAECSPAVLMAGSCPHDSQVGFAYVKTLPFITFVSYKDWIRPVYNVEHPKGWIADLAFIVAGNPVHIRAKLDPKRNYAITSVVPDINETVPAMLSRVVLWGVPGDHSHDSERCDVENTVTIDTAKECPSGLPQKPFLTNPFQCDAPMSMTLKDYDSWDDPGDFGPDITHEIGSFSECDQIPFAPAVSVAPTTDVADSPSGLDVQIDLPQNDSCDPGPPVDCGIATSPLKDATVTLPEGMTVNPASANGLDACTPAQISLGTNDPIKCPEASRIADVQVTTPVLPDPVQGTVYLAAQGNNPFNSLLAAYIVLSEPERGVLVKLPGKVEADPATGQLTGSFKDNPQLPFSKLELHFKGGAHSTLITPATCGDYEANAEFTPWSGTAPASDTNSFTISQGPGGACADAESDLPNSPGFDAGTVSPVSKNHTPFVLHLRRQDGTQRFGAFNVTLPQGLIGKLAGTALCSEGALSAAESKAGREEQASPSCPLASRVGEVVAAAGAGPDPYNAKGDAYLAGPYKGAPVSLAVITPAVAGPFDLGTIVIRTPLRIDSRTAQITALSDPIPQMLEGIPTNVRSIDVIMDRPEFTLTGTSCNPASIGGLLTSTLGQSVPLSVRYQLSDCTRLPFKPQMKLSLKGGTKRGAHPALTVVLRPRPGDANIASLSLAMPRSEFLDQAHIRTICTRAQFAADQCPGAAVYGKASVTTPLLDYPLTGNVYLRSSDNLLPDLVPDLRGPVHQPIKVESAGRTDSIRGGIRNTFDFVPDAPFAKLVTKLPGGVRGLLENSRDICQRTYRATVKYTAHNGMTYVDRPRLGVKCKGKAKRKKRRAAR